MSAGKLVSPIDLRDFLKASGWSLLKEGIEHRLFVFDHQTFPRRQLVFPMDVTAPDYGEAVERVIDKLAEMMGLTVTALASSIANLHDDVLQLRVYFDGDDRSLPLSFASSLVTNAEKMLKASACTVIQPRTNHPKLTLSEANQFIDYARFGQTQVGSFVLNIACPLNAMDAQGRLPLDELDAPFVRQVTLSLQKAVSELVEAIEGDTLQALVDKLKQSRAPLISANLCDALTGMHDDQINNGLEVAFTWSVRRERPQAAINRPLCIQRDYFSRIEEVQRELKAASEDEIDTYVGTVERLEGIMDENGKRSGCVVLSLLLSEGEIVRARTNLSPEDYVLADRAHMSNGTFVKLDGRLRQGRQPRELVDMANFELVSSGSASKST